MENLVTAIVWFGNTVVVPILCDEDTVAVTCGTCSMTDLLDKMENQIMGVV